MKLKIYNIIFLFCHNKLLELYYFIKRLKKQILNDKTSSIRQTIIFYFSLYPRFTFSPFNETSTSSFLSLNCDVTNRAFIFGAALMSFVG